MNQTNDQKEMPYVDTLVTLGFAGQAAILEAELKAGVSLHYEDAQGNYVRENPDGTITLLRKKES